PRPPVLPTESSRRTLDRTPFSPVKRCQMTDDSATANASRTGQSLTAASPRCAAFLGRGPRLVLFVLFFSTLGARTLVAHDSIDLERVKGLVSAADEECALARTA